LASQFANGAGNFSDIVFIVAYGITDLTDWQDRGVANLRSAGTERISTFLFRLRDLCDLKAWPLLRIRCSSGEKLIEGKVRDGENTIASTRDGRAPQNYGRLDRARRLQLR
jgi:hypothetical protein